MTNHCVAHRLNLSVLSTLKSVKYIDDLDALLKRLYIFYQHSPKRMRELKRVTEGLEMKIQKFQYLNNVRWVASKTGALSALVKDWKCVITHLETLVAQKDSAAPLAKGLIKKLTDFKFVYMIHFILDFLKIMKCLSLIFQREELFLSTIKLETKSTIKSLESLKYTPGQHEEDFVNGTSIDGIYQNIQLHGLNPASSDSIKCDKENMIQHAIKYIEERFLVYEDTEKITSVFDTFTWPEGSKLENYGNEEIKMLAEHFQKQLYSKNVPKDYLPLLQNEWYEF